MKYHLLTQCGMVESILMASFKDFSQECEVFMADRVATKVINEEFHPFSKVHVKMSNTSLRNMIGILLSIIDIYL